MRESGLTVEYDTESDVLRGEYLGQSFTVHEDGTVADAGPLRGRLKKALGDG